MPDAANGAAKPRRIPETCFRPDSRSFFHNAGILLPPGWTFEDLLHPESWVSLAPKFKKDPLSGGRDGLGSEITVKTEDMAFKAIFEVRGIVDNGLIVECVGPDCDPKTGKACRPHYYGQVNDVKSDVYETRWNIGKQRHEIRNKSTGLVAAEVATKELAQKWVNEATGSAA